MITGRPPKPPSIKLLEGNKGKRPIDTNIPQFETGDPGYPEWLSESAKEEWRRLAPILISKGLLSEPFRAAFVVYCASWALLQEIQKKIAETDNLELAISKGYINAWIKTSKQTNDALQKFGLSPVDVCRIKGIEAPKRNKLEEFLSRQKPKSA